MRNYNINKISEALKNGVDNFCKKFTSASDDQVKRVMIDRIIEILHVLECDDSIRLLLMDTFDYESLYIFLLIIKNKYEFTIRKKNDEGPIIITNNGEKMELYIGSQKNVYIVWGKEISGLSCFTYNQIENLIDCWHQDLV